MSYNSDSIRRSVPSSPLGQGSLAGTLMPAPGAQPPMLSALDALQMAIEQAEHAADRLIDAITPVSRQPMAQPNTPGNSAAVPGDSAIVGTLIGLRIRLDVITDRLRDARARCEL